jgi:DNA-binding transcriptional ArsR family regulator
VPRPARGAGAREAEASAFDALADPQRRTILAMLSERPRAVGELAASLPVTRPAVSHHLRLLKAAGLVEEERLGTRRIYAVRAEGLEAIQRYLAGVWGEAATRFRLMAENTRRR